MTDPFMGISLQHFTENKDGYGLYIEFENASLKRTEITQKK